MSPFIQIISVCTPMLLAQGPAPAPNTGPAAAAAARTVSPQAHPEAMSDARIVKVTNVSSDGEIKQADLAEKRATSPAVKKLARMIARDHLQTKRETARVVKDKSLAPEVSELSKEIEIAGASTIADLSDRTGADFDRAYVNAQVSQHETSLRYIDTKLLPGAKAEQVKRLVSTIRPRIESHLEQAKALQLKLEK